MRRFPRLERRARRPRPPRSARCGEDDAAFFLRDHGADLAPYLGSGLRVVFRTQYRHNEFVVEIAAEPSSLPESTFFTKARLAIGADCSSIIREHAQRDAVHVEVGKCVVEQQPRRRLAKALPQ